MLRKILLPTLAIAALAGCATGYTYRGGSGDYYYGQPGVEYRYYGAYGGYGYGYGGGYYYDRYGRLIYASPYGGYYGYPYGYGFGYGGWYAPRPRPGHGHQHDHDGDHDGEPGDHRPPPWRDPGSLQPRPPRVAGEDGERGRARVRREVAPRSMPMPQRQYTPGMGVPRESRMGGSVSSGARGGGAARSGKISISATEE